MPERTLDLLASMPSTEPIAPSTRQDDKAPLSVPPLLPTDVRTPLSSSPPLPTDVILVILSKLDAPSLLQATLVCRRWYRLASQYRQSLWRDLAIQDFTFTAPRAYWKLELKPEIPDTQHGLVHSSQRHCCQQQQQQQQRQLRHPTTLKAMGTEKMIPEQGKSQQRSSHQHHHRRDWKALYQQTSNWYRGRARGYCPILLPPSTSDVSPHPAGHATGASSSSSSSATSASSSTASTTSQDMASWLLAYKTPEAIVGLQHEGSASSSISLTPRPASARHVLDHPRVILRSNPHYRRHVPRNPHSGSSLQQSHHQPNIMVQDPRSHDKIAFAISSANPPSQSLGQEPSESEPSESEPSAPDTSSDLPLANTATQEPSSPQPLPASADPMNDIVCHYSSPHHSMVVTGHMDRSVRLWDLSIEEPGQQCIRTWQTTARRQVLCVSMNSRVVVSGNDDSTICVWEIHPDPSKPSPSHGTIHSASYLTSPIPGLDDWVAGIEHICVGDSLVACSTESSGSVLVFSLATGSLVYEIPGLYQPSKLCMTEFFLLTGGRGAWNQGARDRRTNVVEHHHQNHHSTSPTATTPTIEISMMVAGLAWPATGPSSPSFNNVSSPVLGPTSPPANNPLGFEQLQPNGWWGQVQQQQQQQQQQQPPQMRHHPHMAYQQAMRAPSVEEYTTCCINVWDLRTGQRLYSLIPRLPIQPDPAMPTEELLIQSIQKRMRKAKKSQTDTSQAQDHKSSRGSSGKGKQVQLSPTNDDSGITQQAKARKALIRTASYSPDLTSNAFERQRHQGMPGNSCQHATRQRGVYPQLSLASTPSLSPPAYSSSTTWSSVSPPTTSSSAASIYSTPGYGSHPRPASVTSVVIPAPGAGSGDGRFASPSGSSSSSPTTVAQALLSYHPHSRPHPYSSSLSSRANTRREPSGSASMSSPKTPTSPISRPLTLLDMTVTPDHSTLIVALCERWGQGREGVYAWDFSGTRLEGYHDDGEDDEEEEEEEEEKEEDDDADEDWMDESRDEDDENKHSQGNVGGAQTDEDKRDNGGCSGGGKDKLENEPAPLLTCSHGCGANTPSSSIPPHPRLKGLKDLRLRRNDVVMQQVSPSAFSAFHQARITGKIWVGWKGPK